jgi:hypothetical protein
MILTMALLVSAAAGVAPATPPPPDGRPVRVWLDPAGPLAPGGRAKVFVQTEHDGNLIVLVARPSGDVSVLFPAAPGDDPFVGAGTYEVRAPDDGPGLAALGRSGAGLVLAALSPDPVWFGEFTKAGEWDALALTGLGAGADPEATLTDDVQRMLGDGSFNYDVAGYAVTPPAAFSLETDASTPASCLGCSLTDEEVFILVGGRRGSCLLADVGTACAPRSFRAREDRASSAPARPALAWYAKGQPNTGAPAPAPRVASAARVHQAGQARPTPLTARPRPRSALRGAEAARMRALERPAHGTVASAPAPAAAPARAPTPLVPAVPRPTRAAGTLVPARGRGAGGLESTPAPAGGAPVPHGWATAGPAAVQSVGARAGTPAAAPGTAPRAIAAPHPPSAVRVPRAR